MVKFATIGSNFIVHRFLEAAKSVPNFKYVATYSRTHEVGKQLAKQYAVDKIYTSLTELAEDCEIDAVYIASPNSLHKEQAILMMQHQKHVLCEKPIASNAAELAQMEQVAKANNVVLMEAMKSVHCQGYDAVWNNLPKLGVIRNVAFNFLQYSSRYDNYKAGIVENAFNPALSNGALMDIGVYPIHVLLALFDTPQNFKASAIMLANGADASGVILCDYPNFCATLTYSKITSYESNQIQGEEATMIIDKISDIKQIDIIYRDGRKEQIRIGRKNIMIYEIEKFAKAINETNSEDLLVVTRKQMAFLDSVRKQVGIVFPADENWDACEDN